VVGEAAGALGLAFGMACALLEGRKLYGPLCLRFKRLLEFLYPEVNKSACACCLVTALRVVDKKVSRRQLEVG